MSEQLLEAIVRLFALLARLDGVGLGQELVVIGLAAEGDRFIEVPARLVMHVAQAEDVARKRACGRRPAGSRRPPAEPGRRALTSRQVPSKRVQGVVIFGTWPRRTQLI